MCLGDPRGHGIGDGAVVVLAATPERCRRITHLSPVVTHFIYRRVPPTSTSSLHATSRLHAMPESIDGLVGWAWGRHGRTLRRHMLKRGRGVGMNRTNKTNRQPTGAWRWMGATGVVGEARETDWRRRDITVSSPNDQQLARKVGGGEGKRGGTADGDA